MLPPATFLAVRPCQTYGILAARQAKLRRSLRTSQITFDLSGLWAHLSQLSRFLVHQQISRTVSAHLESDLEHIQSTIPVIFVLVICLPLFYPINPPVSVVQAHQWISDLGRLVGWRWPGLSSAFITTCLKSLCSMGCRLHPQHGLGRATQNLRRHLLLPPSSRTAHYWLVVLSSRLSAIPPMISAWTAAHVYAHGHYQSFALRQWMAPIN